MIMKGARGSFDLFGSLSDAVVGLCTIVLLLLVVFFLLLRDAILIWCWKEEKKV